MDVKLTVVGAVLGLAVLLPGELPAQETTTSIVAAAVRERGFICTDPQQPSQDFEASSPGEKAWIIQCDEGSYKVKFMGDTGPQVEPVLDD